MHIRSYAAVAALSLAAGCSSGSAPGNGTAAPDGGLVGHDTNPDGVPYPTRGLGFSARGFDGNGQPRKNPGSVIANYKFLGYPDADRSKGLQTVALADFYDPAGKTFKIIHVAAAGVWCQPCNQETDALVPVAADLRKQGVVFLQAVAEGPTPNVAATKVDLDGWIDAHHSNFTEVLDPLEASLGEWWDRNSLPWNATIDARTMEVLFQAAAYEEPTSVKVWLDWYATNPPASL